MKESNQFVSFKFGDVQFLDILNFLGGATILDCLSKARKTSERNSYFPYECFDDTEKLNIPKLLPCEAFFSKLRNSNPLEKGQSYFQSLLEEGMTSKEA